MTPMIRRFVLMLGLAAALWAWNGEIWPTSQGNMIATAEAVVGRPATPVSYAGVARRSPVGAGAPGWCYAESAGAGGCANRGGPVNRVGVR